VLTPFFYWWVLSALGNNFTEAFAAVFGQRLVTRGPYRYLRHPLYAIECILLVGVSVTTANWLIFAFACSGIVTIRLIVIPREEEYLVERFGKSYKKYMSTTGRLIPRLTRTKRQIPSGRTL
jgi:protein-S-isoprenylcysteine O-methyltransferase Ste14